MILFYDTETTGFPDSKRPLSEQPRIVQIGAILSSPEGKEVARLDTLVRVGEVPANVLHAWTVGKDNDGGAAKIHGVTPEDCERYGMTEAIMVDAFLDMVAVADLIVGHNHVSFDNKLTANVVRRVFDKPDVDPFAGKAMFDTIEAGKQIMRLPSRQGGFRKPKLSDLHQHLLGEGFEDAHRAISDVKATRRIYFKMQEMVNAARAQAEQAA